MTDKLSQMLSSWESEGLLSQWNGHHFDNFTKTATFLNSIMNDKEIVLIGENLHHWELFQYNEEKVEDKSQ